ncbi:hypothetical protein B5F83_02845, partial [Muribaculum sp. An289]|uniref:hypothetical protein n=1 Tax=unclassified Muribaculum TaxID=2622126 RepID=UPI000B56A522
SFFRFNELPPAGGGTEAPLPERDCKGSALCRISKLFKDFFSTFFGFFSIFTRLPRTFRHFTPPAAAFPLAPPGRGTHPQGQTTGKHGIALRHIPWARNRTTEPSAPRGNGLGDFRKEQAQEKDGHEGNRKGREHPPRIEAALKEKTAEA